MPVQPISTTIQELFTDVALTYLTADVASAAETLSVKSINDFAINQVLFIGDLGDQDSEIINTSTTTAPTGTDIKLASGLVFAHSAGTIIRVIDYDQVEISHSDTVAGVKTVLSTVDIDADAETTVYRDSTASAGYYFIRFKNTITTTYSAYSDPVPYTGFAENQVGDAMDYALQRNKMETYSSNIDHNFCINEINNCLRFVHGKRKKWHRLQSFDYILGQTVQGDWRFSCPSTMWDYSNKSVLDVHLAGEESLLYRDERQWNELLGNLIFSELKSAASVGDITITLDNSFGFGSSGTVMCQGQDITFTANDTATGVLSGVPATGTGSVTATLAVDDFVFNNDNDEGLPLYYTVKEGYVYIWPLPSSSYDNINVLLDFWKETPVIDSDADTLDISRYDMVKYWLTWKIRMQKNNDGKLDYKDGDYQMFMQVLGDSNRIENQASGQKYRMKPVLNKISY